MIVAIARSRVQYNKYFTGFTLCNFLHNNQIRGMNKICTRIVCKDLDVIHLLLPRNLYFCFLSKVSSIKIFNFVSNYKYSQFEELFYY